MTERERTSEIAREITIDGKQYSIVIERERGVGLYADEKRTRYVRIGIPSMVARELSFHKELLANGFPVAKILAEGKLGNREYWIEESLGDKHFGNIFKEETGAHGEISEESLTRLLLQVQRMHDAQERHIGPPIDAASLATSVQFQGLVDEMPGDADTMREAFTKISNALVDYPSCLTHGDLTAHNILHDGVIDFGDHFRGPVGFDMLNVITAPFWFPKNSVHGEYTRGFRFSDTHIARFFDAVGVFSCGERTINLRTEFDAFFLLKAHWWTVKNHRMPKLQEWRYDRLRELVRRYNADESLYGYWMARKDD